MEWAKREELQRAEASIARVHLSRGTSSTVVCSQKCPSKDQKSGHIARHHQFVAPSKRRPPFGLRLRRVNRVGLQPLVPPRHPRYLEPDSLQYYSFEIKAYLYEHIYRFNKYFYFDMVATILVIISYEVKTWLLYSWSLERSIMRHL